VAALLLVRGAGPQSAVAALLLVLRAGAELAAIDQAAVHWDLPGASPAAPAMDHAAGQWDVPVLVLRAGPELPTMDQAAVHWDSPPPRVSRVPTGGLRCIDRAWVAACENISDPERLPDISLPYTHALGSVRRCTSPTLRCQ